MKVHEKYIKRCIQLAKNGLGTTYPNPLVGSVIVHDGEIIGEGWHQKAGGPHAEVHAVNSVKDESLLAQSTIYVSLEPCSHFGKTPPCCDLILARGIPNIVVGTVDPFAAVAGNGIKKLLEAGRNVTAGILEAECRELNKRFFTFHEKKRPYIILKWAQTSDGFIAPEKRQEQKPVWITGEISRQLVHKWRTEEQSILVGKQTVIADNPKLDARNWSGNNPVRIVLGSIDGISKESHIFDNEPEAIFISIEKNNPGAHALVAKTLEVLAGRQIQSVIIEGGKQTLQAFIDAGMWDEARVFKGNISFGEGIKAPLLQQDYKEKLTIQDDELLIFSNHD